MNPEVLRKVVVRVANPRGFPHTTGPTGGYDLTAPCNGVKTCSGRSPARQEMLLAVAFKTIVSHNHWLDEGHLALRKKG